MAMLAMLTASVMSLVPATVALADEDPERRWAHIVEANGFVDNISICTWNVCGDPESFYRQDHNSRGIILLDLDQMNLEQQPGPGWWYVDGQFIRDSFEKNASGTAGIHKVSLSWSTGGLGMSDDGVTFSVAVAPTGQVVETSASSVEITSLTPEVEHSFTITATLPDGSARTAPVVSATPLVDPNPDCLPSNIATECLSATNWAHVQISDGAIVTVSVCTTAVCGDRNSDYSRIYRERGIMLVELVDTPAWTGWMYRDGVFIPPAPDPQDTADPLSRDGDAETTEERDPIGAEKPDDTEPADADDPTTRGESGFSSLSIASPIDGEDAFRPRSAELAAENTRAQVSDKFVIPQVLAPIPASEAAESPEGGDNSPGFIARFFDFLLSLFFK
jgi:hypothetical protein